MILPTLTSTALWHSICSGWSVFAIARQTSRTTPVASAALAAAPALGAGECQVEKHAGQGDAASTKNPNQLSRLIRLGLRASADSQAASDNQTNSAHSSQDPGHARDPDGHTDDGNNGDHGHSGDRGASSSQREPRGSRLNLLLSYAGWQSDSWIERLPRILEPMGVTSHTAWNGKEASKLITQTRIHVAIVDLGLPLDETQHGDVAAEFSEGGPRLLELLSRLSEPPPVVAVKRSRTHRDDSRELAAALRHGAFAVVDRPHDLSSMNLMLEVLRRCLERHYRGCWPSEGGPTFPQAPA